MIYLAYFIGFVAVAGIVGSSRRINGYLFSIHPLMLKKNLKIFSENKREITILESKEFGKIVYGKLEFLTHKIYKIICGKAVSARAAVIHYSPAKRIAEEINYFHFVHHLYCQTLLFIL